VLGPGSAYYPRLIALHLPSYYLIGTYSEGVATAYLSFDADIRLTTYSSFEFCIKYIITVSYGSKFGVTMPRAVINIFYRTI